MRSLFILAGTSLVISPQINAAEYTHGEGDGETGRPNVIFIAVDDLRPTLGCYGDPYAKTPAIDKVAQSGTIFSHNYCQQAVSNPSRSSMLTGFRPDQTGVTDLNTHFREKNPDIVTLPQLFKNNGYYVYSTGKIFHSGGKMRDDVSWNEQASAYDRREYILEQNLTKKAGKAASTERGDVGDEAYPDGKIANDAVEFLQKAVNMDEPFFLAIGFKKPHLPFCAPSRYWDMYAGVDFKVENRARPVNSPDIAYHNWNELRGYSDIPKAGPLLADKEQELWQGYYACVSYVDAQLGKVLTELERLKLSDNTIIILWGDHGYHLGEQDLWCKSTNFELDNKVPLIISTPKQKTKGKQCDAITESVDIYPTLAGLCRMQTQSKLAGISLERFLDDPEKDWEYYAFSQFPRPYEAITKPVATTMGYTVRTPQWRCTYWYEIGSGAIVSKELYNLDSDNPEITNLSGNKEVERTEEKLASILDNYRKGIYQK
ncbi:sulfatase [Dysgonomonas gadei]|uniref:sulfatase n=1 Tax=Dysgonomonas gadei TaxID=156974 RepID=UPI003AEF4755